MFKARVILAIARSRGPSSWMEFLLDVSKDYFRVTCMVAAKAHWIRSSRLIGWMHFDLIFGIFGLVWLLWNRTPALSQLMQEVSKTWETLPARAHAASLPVTNLELEPKQVQVICDFLTEHNIPEYFLDSSFHQDELIYHRIIEGCWPFRWVAAAKNGFTIEGFVSAYSADSVTKLSEKVFHVKRHD